MEIKIQAIQFRCNRTVAGVYREKSVEAGKNFRTSAESDVSLKVVKPATAMNKQASITVSFPGNTAFAEKTCDTFEESVDQCVDSLKVQLTKIKEKQREH